MWLINLLLLLFTTAIQATTPLHAAADPASVLQQMIRAEQTSLDKLVSNIDGLKQSHQQWLSRVNASTPSESDLEQARLGLESAQVDAQSVQLDQTSTRHQIEKLQTEITDLQHQISNLGTPKEVKSRSLEENLQQELKQQQTLLALKQQYLGLLAKRSNLVAKKVELSRQWLKTLQAIEQKQQQAQRRESLADLERKLQLEIQERQSESNRLQQQLEQIAPGDPEAGQRQARLTWEIQFLNESISLINGRLKLASNKAEVENIGSSLLGSVPPDTLKRWLTRIEDIQQRVIPAISLTEGKIKVLEQQQDLLEKRHALQGITGNDYRQARQKISNLIDGFQKQQQALKQLQQEIQKRSTALEQAYQWNLNRSLTARQLLPRDPAVWRSLAAETGLFPTTLIQFAGATGRDLSTGWRNADMAAKSGFSALLLLLVGVVAALSRLPRPGPQPMADDQTFSMKTREVLYALLRCSRPVVLLGGSLLAAGWLFGIEEQRFRLLLLLVLIWLAFQWMTRLSYWLFVSPLVPPAQRQPNLHRTIFWVISLSAFFTLLVGMGHFGFLSESMRALIDRLFMLLLLPLVYLSLRMRTLFILRMRTESRSSFWPGLIGLLSLAIPLTTLAAAVVGLAGYINLAWFVAGQLALVLIVLMGWLVLRHLLLDAVACLRQEAETHPKQSPFWTRGVIDPLQLLLKLALLLLTAWVLVLTLTWSSGTDIEGLLKTALGSTLFTVGRQTVTSLHLFSAILLLFFVVYLGIWSRRLTYDLFYQQVHDRGLRNSLSVFTQYAIIVVGLLLALNLLGIDLTSLTVFAGALGVGIGFGLQNIANNFISGLILLAERPVRTEDWVSIGNHDGRIRRIGMRSLVLTTWDNQDVIIPNAQLITNPVTNWTLSNSLVRTVFEVGIRYQDDPHLAQKVIEEAVSMQPEVSLERPPRILLSEFGDSSVNFRVEFFAVVECQSSRLKIKSVVMFAIWDALKEAAIGIPFPQQDIYIKEIPNLETREGPGPHLFSDEPHSLT